MQTMGTIFIEIQETENSTPEQVLILGIREKAYPQHIGKEIYKALDSVTVTNKSDIGRAILSAFGKFPNDSHYKGSDFRYTITIQPYKLGEFPNTLLEITEFDLLACIPMKVGEMKQGSASEFWTFCTIGVV